MPTALVFVALDPYTHGVGLVILLRDGDACVKNRSDALIFSILPARAESGDRSDHANLK